MARVSPEERVHVINTLDYLNGNLQSTTPFYLTTYYRTYSGGAATPGFPRFMLYHNHEVRMRSVKSVGSSTLVRTYTNSPTWSKTVDGTWGTILNAGNTSGLPSTYMVDDVAHATEATTAVENKVMDQVADAKFNFAQFIAERQQVSNLIADTAGKLARCYSYLRAKDFPKAFKALGLSFRPNIMTKNLANNWLALQYGWKPLLSDCKSAAEHLAQNHLGRPMRLNPRVSMKFQYPELVHTGFWSVGLNGQYGTGGRFRFVWGKRVTQAKCELKFVVTNAYIREAHQLGISDPLLLTWELLPYSFVVDWFIPIGDFISKLNYDSGLIYEGGCTTLVTTQLCEVGPVAGTYQAGVQLNTLSGTPTVIQNMRFQRKILPSAPRPEWPQFKDPFSATHVLNALALMRGSFRPR